MGRIKELFKNKIGGIFKRSGRVENTAKHSLEKLGNLLSKRKKSGSTFESIGWDQIYSSIFSPISRKKIHRIFIIALVGTMAYGTGKVIALITSSSEPKIKSSRSQSSGPIASSSGRIQQDLNQIKKTNLFNARESDQDAVDRFKKKTVVNDSDICLTSNKKSSLPIKLINTVVLQDSVKSIASVQVRNGKELLTLRQGDKIKSMAKISLIDRRKVIIQNLSSGSCEHIENLAKKTKRKPLKVISPQAGKKLISSMKKDGIKNEGNTYTLKRTFVQDSLKNISDLLTQARAIPIKNPDGSMCFKMTDIVAGSLYTQLGIQNDDSVCEMDGKKIMSVNQMMQKFGKIKDIENLQLGLLRAGSEVRKDYSIE